MTTKHGRTMLAAMNRSGKTSFSVSELSKLCGGKDSHIILTVEHLEQLGFVKVDRIQLPYGGREVIRNIQLTELGRSFREIRRQAIRSYILDKWTDVLASMIALCSLIVSIIALSRTL